jgi:hypothetical protein
MRRFTVWLWAFFFVAGGAYAQPATMMQEGLLFDADGVPLADRHTLDFALFDAPIGGVPLWFETHDVDLFEGYYAARLGAQRPLPDAALAEPQLFLQITIDGGQPLAPRTELASVPWALRARVAQNVTGDITPSSITVGGREVIDGAGTWRGDPTGLRGANCFDATGDVNGDGNIDLADCVGEAGDNGSPDTPQQVRTKLLTVDGAGSGIDADRVDGMQAGQFMRADANTGTTGSLSVIGKVSLADGRIVGEVAAGAAFLGVNRAAVNGEVGLRLSTNGAEDWVLYQSPGDDSLRVLGADLAFNQANPQLLVTRSGQVQVDSLRVERSVLMGSSRIQDQEALVLGNGISADDLADDQASAVLGYAGFGVRHGAMGWYGGLNRFELYDTSPASPADAYDSGTRPYVSLKALDVMATRNVDSTSGYTVGGVAVIDGNGSWVGPRVPNADRLDGLDSADFARANTLAALTARVQALENAGGGGNGNPAMLLEGTTPALFKRYTALGHTAAGGLTSHNNNGYGPSWSHGNTALRGADATGDLERQGALVFTDDGRFNETTHHPNNSIFWGALTFFIRAPAARNVTLDLTVTDSVINLNGAMIHQGAFGHDRRGTMDVPFRQGSNVLSIRSLHHADWSALIVYNRWIRANGLEIDWAAMNAALRGQ